jgi:broad specificity phosphatase PhoE
METLLLVRHASAGSNRAGTASFAVPGEGLTSEGIAQGIELGKLLAGEQIGLGVATELRRTQETLELALHGRDAPTIVVPELNEIHFGSFDSGPLEAYRAWAAAQSPSLPAPGGGESRATAAARCARGLRLLLERPEAVVLLVGHALAVRYVLDAAHGLPPAARMTPVEHARPYRLGADDVTAAARLLEGWSQTPRFRDPSIEGWAGSEPRRPSRG